MERFGRSWVESHQEACVATTIRGEQAAELLDLRIQCLGKAQIEATAIVQQLARVDPKTLPTVGKQIEALPALDGCRDVAELQDGSAMMLDATRRAELEVLQDAVGEAKPSWPRETQEAAKEGLLEVRDRIDALEYPPLRAEAVKVLDQPATCARQHRGNSAVEK